jgi:hypothetical protein
LTSVARAVFALAHHRQLSIDVDRTPVRRAGVEWSKRTFGCAFPEPLQRKEEFSRA